MATKDEPIFWGADYYTGAYYGLEYVGGAAVVAASQVIGVKAFASAGKGISFEDYVGLDAVELSNLVKTDQATPAELLEAAIARAEVVNPKINAIVLPYYDRAREAVKAGLPKGPFRGVPWLLKDLHLAMKGTITSNGSVPWKDAVASYDSTLVERYRDAGLVVFGKSASPEFGGTATTESKLWGATRNPWNLEHTPGGSSGGSAAAVAAGILPAANASDGGGSIRIPASCCGLFGLKPSRGRVPMGPKRYTAHDFSCIHAVTRSVRDSAALLDVSHGVAPYEYYTAPPVERPYAEEVRREPGALRVGWLELPVHQLPPHADCTQAAADAAKLCESLGHRVEPVRLPIDPRAYYDAVGVNSTIHTARRIRARSEELGRKILPEEIESITWANLAASEKLTADDLAGAMALFREVTEQMGLLMQRYDVLLSPTLARPPEKIGVMSLSNPDPDEFTDAATYASAFTMLYNVSGQPAMSLPLHWNEAGLPIGVMFAAAYGREDVLFRLAAQIEQARPWFDRRPPLEA